jgi:capsular polysaccharide transport system permease protein
MTPPPEDRPLPRPDLRAVAPDPRPRPAAEARAADDGTAGEPAAEDAAAGDAEARNAKARNAKAGAAAREAREGKRRRRRGRHGQDAAAAVPLPARARPRHWGALAGFLLLVALPFAAATGYLFSRAADQYHSEVAFSVRSEEVASATAGLLGALTQIGSGGAPDAAILYDYIRSQEIVAAVDARLDLRTMWNRPGSGWRDGDPVFTLGPDPTIEALHGEWLRMVAVSYDTTAGIIDVVARAFTPGDAKAIADAVLAESSALVNTLADQAREDAVRFAREELAEAEAHLAGMRRALGDFRREHSLVDPSADVAGQSGLLNALNAELAQALVDRDVLTSYAGDGDQRVLQADRRIAAITERIEAERATLGVTGVAGSLPDVVGRYEELSVDLEFANQAYTQALAGVAAAQAEARRQSRYLAAHVRPTAATTALYPRRALLAGLTGLFLLLGWGILMLVYYNVRDSR